ncbi:MAG: hypothetical protein ACK4K7_02170 [Allosphingosinicella sp.]|uniref:hypothetical protein n=1 Tax=Allosphingosinicella sp. TaxID=2823234 RepID=UPI003954FE35
MATTAGPAMRWRTDRIFYTSLGAAIALTCFWGFARSYYLSRWFDPPPGTPEITALLAVHGAVFTAWLVFLVTQPLLIAGRQTRTHRKLGYAGAGIAAAMVLFGNIAAVAAMHQGFIGLGDPRIFYAVPFFAINSFAVAVALAIYWRKRAETHKRLIMLSNVGIVGAAIARLPVDAVQAGAPLTFIFLPNLITLAGIAYDWRTRGRVHKVWVWGGLAMLLSQLAMLAVMGSGPWIAFAETMRGLW